MNGVKLICLAGYLFAAVSLDIFLFTKFAKAFWILGKSMYCSEVHGGAGPGFRPASAHYIAEQFSTAFFSLWPSTGSSPILFLGFWNG